MLIREAILEVAEGLGYSGDEAKTISEAILALGSVTGVTERITVGFSDATLGYEADVAFEDVAAAIAGGIIVDAKYDTGSAVYHLAMTEHGDDYAMFSCLAPSGLTQTPAASMLGVEYDSDGTITLVTKTVTIS